MLKEIDTIDCKFWGGVLAFVQSSDHDVAVLCKTPEIALTGVPKLLTTQQNGSLGTERVSMGARS